MIDFNNFGWGDALKLGSAATALGGGVVGAVGAGQAAAGQAASYRARAKAYRQDALEQGYGAAQTWFALGRQQQRADYGRNRMLGAQRAAYGAAGLDPGGGSPLDVMADTEQQYRFDALDRYSSGLAAARRAGRQSEFDLDAAKAEDEAARAAAKAGRTSGFGSILGGLGSALGIVGKLFF